MTHQVDADPGDNEGPDLAAATAQIAEWERQRKLAAARDALARANHPGTPPWARAFANSAVFPGFSDLLDSHGADLETGANHLLTGFDRYTPELAQQAVREAGPRIAAQHRRDHPGQVIVGEALGGAAQTALAARAGIPAPLVAPLSGAVGGAITAAPGRRIEDALSGALEAGLIDQGVGRFVGLGGASPGGETAAGNLIAAAAQHAIEMNLKPWAQDDVASLAAPRPNRASMPQTIKLASGGVMRPTPRPSQPAVPPGQPMPPVLREAVRVIPAPTQPLAMALYQFLTAPPPRRTHR